MREQVASARPDRPRGLAANWHGSGSSAPKKRANGGPGHAALFRTAAARGKARPIAPRRPTKGDQDETEKPHDHGSRLSPHHGAQGRLVLLSRKDSGRGGSGCVGNRLVGRMRHLERLVDRQERDAVGGDGAGDVADRQHDAEGQDNATQETKRPGDQAHDVLISREERRTAWRGRSGRIIEAPRTDATQHHTCNPARHLRLRVAIGSASIPGMFRRSLARAAASHFRNWPNRPAPRSKGRCRSGKTLAMRDDPMVVRRPTRTRPAAPMRPSLKTDPEGWPSG